MMDWMCSIIEGVRCSYWAFYFMCTLLVVNLICVNSITDIYCLGFPVYNSILFSNFLAQGDFRSTERRQMRTAVLWS